MPDEYKLNEASARGVRAKNLLDNDLLIESYAKIEADLVAGWIGSDPRDTAGRELAWHQVIANRKHKQHLESVMNSGKIADSDLSVMKKLFKR